MRGKRVFTPPIPKRVGLIPAHAGKTRVNNASGKRVRAHPRACGENLPISVGTLEAKGSSPRMRGKRASRCVRLRGCGLIPAHAGKTQIPTSASQRTKAHPRACGENLCAPIGYVPVSGSSPRMRGKRFSGVLYDAFEGLIPAHAGKTRSFTSPVSGSSAHPRACGENLEPSPRVRGKRGSSPRMRGKQSYEEFTEHMLGLIPAHAGKTQSREHDRLSDRAHPRACGENCDATIARRWPAGSSPRMRGKPYANAIHWGRKGLIPAHAGKTPLAPARPILAPAHPRACGENIAPGEGMPLTKGSSPRMRGKRRR